MDPDHNPDHKKFVHFCEIVDNINKVKMYNHVTNPCHCSGESVIHNDLRMQRLDV